MATATEKHWQGSKANHWYGPDAFAVPESPFASDVFSEIVQWGVGQAAVDRISVYAACKQDEVELYKSEGFVPLDTLPCGPVTGVLLELKK
jgi:hypothetical protein